MEASKDDRNTLSAEFMLKEYERLSSLRLNEIAQTEQRFNFFLTISTASIGATAFFSQIANLSPHVYYTAMQGLLSLVLLFGLVNQNRQNMRYIYLRSYERQIEEIQAFFANLDSDVASYFIKVRDMLEMQRPKSKMKKAILSRFFRGTLTDNMVLANSAICAAITSVSLLSKGSPLQVTAAWTILTFILAAVGLYTYNGAMRKVLWTSG